MNKTVKMILILAVVVIALGSASIVYAQSTTPEGPCPETGFGYGVPDRGNRGSRGMWGSFQGENKAGTQDGLLHDAMIEAFAEKLELSVEDLNTRLADGETMAQIALSEGLTFEEFKDIMVEVRNLAVDQALEDGTLTEEQAEWLKSRGTGMGMRDDRGLYRSGDCSCNQTTP